MAWIIPPRVRPNTGVNKGNWAYYVDVDGVRTNGFRYFGQSDAERAYGDIGYRAWNSELHLSMTGGADGLGVAGTTPLELANENPSAVFTTPQTTNTTAEMITLSDETHITPTLTFNRQRLFPQLCPGPSRRQHQRFLPLHSPPPGRQAITSVTVAILVPDLARPARGNRRS